MSLDKVNSTCNNRRGCFFDTGDASVRKTLLSSQSIWVKAHKQSTECGPVAVHLLNEGFLQQTSNRQLMARRVFQVFALLARKRNNSLGQKNGNKVSSCVENDHYLTKYLTLQHVLVTS